MSVPQSRKSSSERRRTRRSKAKGRSDSERIGIIVAGMHRSGTSALTRVLNLLGADLPGNLRAAVPDDNERGFWESQDVMSLDDEILASVGQLWHSVHSFPRSWLGSASSERFKEKALQFLQAEFEDSPLFVIKEPRLCRFLPFWVEVLEEFGAQPHFVLPIRNPLEVAMSLRKRNDLALEHGLLLWLRHCLDAEHDTRGYPRALVEFEELLNDWRRAMDRVSEALEVPALVDIDGGADEVDAFLSVDLRHNQIEFDDFTDRPDIACWVKTAYASLREMSESPGRSHQAERNLDEIRRDMETADLLFLPLLSEWEARANTHAGEEQRLHAELEARQEQAQAAVAERDLRIEAVQVELKVQQEHTRTVAAERDGRITALQAELKVQQEQSATGLAERDSQIATLRDHSDQLARAAVALLASRRWRWGNRLGAMKQRLLLRPAPAAVAQLLERRIAEHWPDAKSRDKGKTD